MCHKIAILLNDFSGTGVPRVTLRLAEGLINLGYDIDIIVLNPRGPMRTMIGASTRIVPLNVSRAVKALPKLISYLRTIRPRAIVAAEDQLGIMAAVACILTRSKARLLVTSHVPYSHTNIMRGIKGQVVFAALRLVWRRIDTFSTVSQGLADDMAQETGLPRSEIQVLHNAVVRDEDITRVPDPSIHAFFRSGAKVIVGIGSLHRRKGFHDLIDAVRIVSAIENVRLIILGEGRERESLQNKISEDGLSHIVDLVGYSSNPYAFLQVADLFVLPSYFEGLPTVLIEALACGCPCVATDCVSGPREILVDGELGILVGVGDYEAMAKAIVTTLNSPIPAGVLQHRAADFTASVVSKQAIKFLQ